MRQSAQFGRAAAALATVMVVGLSAGCGSSKENSSSASMANPAAGASIGNGGANGANSANSGGLSGDTAPSKPAAPGSGQNSLAKTPIPGRSLVYTATMTVRTKDVATATANAESLATANGGFVGDEKSQSGTVPDVKGLTQSTVTLRVPSTAFDKVIDQLNGNGTVQDETRSASDVTSQVVDTDTRITAQEAAITRITDLMKNAANMSDVVTLEGELSRRESDLESMQAQLAALKDQVSLSTITVTYLVPEAPALAKPAVKHRNALQRGLHDGWQAFVDTIKVLLVIFGVVLPFAVLVAVLWWPVMLLTHLSTRLRARQAQQLRDRQAQQSRQVPQPSPAPQTPQMPVTPQAPQTSQPRDDQSTPTPME